MRPKGINWAEIAPKYAALGRGNADGKKALADEYGIDSVSAMTTGLSAWRKKQAAALKAPQETTSATAAAMIEAPDLTVPLSSDEAALLAHYETIIEQGLQSFVAVGTALMDIREKKLYRSQWTTFEEYLDRRWGLGRAHAYRLMDAAQVVHDIAAIEAPPDRGLPGQASVSMAETTATTEAAVTTEDHATGEMSPIGDKTRLMPENEAQARELAKVPAEERRQVWEQVTTTAPDGKVTASHVRDVVADHLGPKPIPGVPRVVVDEVATDEKGKRKPKTPAHDAIVAPCATCAAVARGLAEMAGDFLAVWATETEEQARRQCEAVAEQWASLAAQAAKTAHVAIEDTPRKTSMI
jgi:hypothetical protein